MNVLLNKNKEKSTALEISCFKGYFEMSKLIMSRINSTIDDNLSSQNNLIHLASDSGASEVVRLLLSKGIYYIQCYILKIIDLLIHQLLKLFF